jgi:hypothetical protein
MGRKNKNNNHNNPYFNNGYTPPIQPPPIYPPPMMPMYNQPMMPMYNQPMMPMYNQPIYGQVQSQPQPHRCHYHEEQKNKSLEYSINKCNSNINQLRSEFKEYMNNNTPSEESDYNYNKSWIDALVTNNRNNSHYFIDYIFPYMKEEHRNMKTMDNITLVLKGKCEIDGVLESIDVYLYEPELISYFINRFKVMPLLKDFDMDIILMTSDTKYILTSTSSYPITLDDTHSIIESNTLSLYFDTKEKRVINKKIMKEYLEKYGKYPVPTISMFVERGINITNFKTYKQQFNLLDKPSSKTVFNDTILVEGNSINEVMDKLSTKLFEGKLENIFDGLKDYVKDGETIDDIEIIEEIDEVEEQNKHTPEIVIEPIDNNNESLEDDNIEQMEEDELDNPIEIIIEDIEDKDDNIEDDNIEDDNNEDIEVIEDDNIEDDNNEDDNNEDIEVIEDDNNEDDNANITVDEPQISVDETAPTEEELINNYTDIVLKHYLSALMEKVTKKFIMIN